jgi:hypothetical protein
MAKLPPGDYVFRMEDVEVYEKDGKQYARYTMKDLRHDDECPWEADMGCTCKKGCSICE